MIHVFKYMIPSVLIKYGVLDIQVKAYHHIFIWGWEWGAGHFPHFDMFINLK